MGRCPNRAKVYLPLTLIDVRMYLVADDLVIPRRAPIGKRGSRREGGVLLGLYLTVQRL